MSRKLIQIWVKLEVTNSSPPSSGNEYTEDCEPIDLEELWLFFLLIFSWYKTFQTSYWDLKSTHWFIYFSGKFYSILCTAVTLFQCLWFFFREASVYLILITIILFLIHFIHFILLHWILGGTSRYFLQCHWLIISKCWFLFWMLLMGF